MKAIMKDPRKAPRSIVLSGGFGCGKCVPGDVRLQTDSGYRKISTLYNEPKVGFNDMVYKVYTRNGWKETSHFYYEPKCKVYNIELSNGSIIRGTDKHKILAYNKESGAPELLRMDSLSIGDFVFKNTKVEDNGNEYHDPRLAFLLGMITHCGVHTDSELHMVIKEIASKGFLVLMPKIIKQHFPKVFNKSNQYIPEMIWYMDIESRISYLQGLMHLSDSEYAFIQGSEDFVKELAELSDSLGLCYHIGANTIKFKGQVESTKERLNSVSMLCNIFEYQPPMIFERSNIIPVHQSIIDDLDKTSFNVYSMNKYGVMLSSTVDKLDDVYGYSNEKLNQFKDLHSTTIVGITYTIEDVYDLTVPDGHEFIAQGIANHNTTSCRILAKAINCPNRDTKGNPCNKPTCNICSQDLESSSFYVEYDSSIVGNVEKIKELRDTFYYKVDNQFKIIVLDECHLASNKAQSSLLKSIEDAPHGIMFVFATTHPHQLLDTILSRSLQLKVTTVSTTEIEQNLRDNANSLGMDIDETSIKLIANRSKGHMRNAHMLLDLYSLIGAEDFRNSVKSAREALIKYLISIVNKNSAMLFESLNDIQTFPIADVKDDLDALLLEMTKLLVEKDDTPLSKLTQAFGVNLLKLVKQISSDWVKNAFSNDLEAQTALLALYELMTQSMVTQTKQQVRGK